MDKFIEKLKEHGYEVLNREVSNVHYWEMGGSAFIYIPVICPIVYDNPDLAFWCLGEIERLGWDWQWESSTWGFKGAVKNTASRPPLVCNEFEGKTKTETCMNALIAVLETKGD